MPLEEYPMYEVSNQGHVRNLKTGRILMREITLEGYARVKLYKNGRNHKEYIHKLVYVTFVDRDFIYGQIKHLDGDRLNNFTNNLECLCCENEYSDVNFGTISDLL